MKKLKQHIFKIVLTGPESSGKTVLAADLARALQTVWVPEFARSYLAYLPYSYARPDLERIGRGQQAWEEWYSERANQFLVCDTDWTVLHIWEHYRYGIPADGLWHWQKGFTNPQAADLYLLCTPDFPSEPDPLRENPEEREILFGWYEHLLQSMGLDYMKIDGNHAGRLDTAISRIDKLFGTL